MTDVFRTRLNPPGTPRATAGAGGRSRVVSGCLHALLFGAILGLGLYGTLRTASVTDGIIRARLLHQARSIARSIDPDLGRALSFTTADTDRTAFIRIREHLCSYAAILKPKGIYTLARRGDLLRFGPETYVPGDPLACPPGTTYQLPPADVVAVFDRTRPDAVFGPTRDEYGTFVTALAPVVDPRTGDILLAVGVDLLAEDWAAEIRRASWIPLGIAALAILLTGTALVLLKRRRDASHPPGALHTEPLVAGWAGLLLTLFTTGLLYEMELTRRENTLDQLAAGPEEILLSAVRRASGRLSEVAAFFNSSEKVTPEEFDLFLEPLAHETSLRFIAWIPDRPESGTPSGPDPAPTPLENRPYVWPAAAETFRPGLTSAPVQALLRQARATDLPFVSLPQPGPEQPDRAGLLYLTRYIAAPAVAPESGARRYEGWLVLGLEPVRLFESLTDSRAPADEMTCLCLLDISRSLDSPRSIPLNPGADGPDGACLALRFKREFSRWNPMHLTPLFLFDRTYAIHMRATPAFRHAYALRTSQLAGAAGLLFTALLTFLVALLRRRQTDLERGVLMRTAEVREREQNLSVTLQSIADGVIVTDSSDRVVRMNPVAEQLTGWTQADARDHGLSAVYCLAPADPIAPDTDRPGGRTTGPADPAILISRDGRTFPVSDSVAPIRNESGAEIGRILVFRDITEIRAAQAAVENSERQYQLLFDGLLSGFALHEVLTDPSGAPVDYRFLKINSVYERLIGREAKDVVGRTVRELFPETESFWIESLGQIALTGRPMHLEHLNSALNRQLEVEAFCPKPGQFATLVQDITDQRNLEEERYRLERSLQQKQRLESLGVLAGGIAHDFNNLLMVILGNAELVRQSLTDASPNRAPLQDIATAARHAVDLCRQLLAYAGRGRYAVEPLDLNRMVTEMTPILKTVLSQAIALDFRLGPSLPSIEGDASQLRQVLLNLTLNASEAIPDGQGTITVSSGAMLCTSRHLRELSHGGDLSEGLYVFLEVSDTGCGMTPDVLAQIFDPFFTTKFVGRGLGLAAVLGIVRGHRGALDVASEPGKGTVFKAFFPTLGETTRSRAQSASSLSHKVHWVDRKKMILAERDRSIRAVGKHLLEQLGIQTLTARSGAEAVELFRAQSDSISCVLLDPHLREPGGEDPAAAIRRIRPDVPILYSGDEDMKGPPPGASGALSGFLRKPYDINALVDALNPLLAPIPSDRPAARPPARPDRSPENPV